MRNLIILLCIFTLMFLSSAAFALELDLEKFMPVDEIKPGMKGIGKTVFEGTKIEEFQIEVLSVDRNYTGPKGDVIWVLCSGGPLAETGVLRGMSGSPVYIDGRLIGAVALTYSFAKKPIAGVTSIASMLRVFEKEESEQSGLGYLPPSHYDELDGSFAYDNNDPSQWQLETSSLPSGGSSISIVPIQTPVMMSGFHPRAIEDVVPMFRKLGMIPVQGGGTSSEAELEEIPLEPGAVLGVQFVRGDLSMFGYGTLTYVHDNRILAFGHAMYGMGRINLPVAGGRITFLTPSMMISSKYATPGKIMGTLAYDSRYGIMGVIGEEPDFIPMKVRINSQEYNFEIAKHRLFSPALARSVAGNIIYSEGKELGDYTMKIHSEIQLRRYPTISKDNVFSGTSPSIVASAFASPLFAIMQNAFEEVDVESILLEIEFEDKRTNARIDGVQINKDRIRPGDSLEITVLLTPYLEDTVTKRFEAVVPNDIPEGRSFLRISDVASNESWEKSRAPMKSRTSDLSHLIQQIREEESNNDIIVEIFAPKLGVTIRDQELPALPLTALSVMSSRKQAGGSGFTRGTTFMKQRIHTDYVVSGSAMLLLDIDRDAP